VPSWTIQKENGATSFSYIRQFPGLNESMFKNGVVLVFARNLWSDDHPSLNELNKEVDKPLMMPFYFLPYFEKPDYTEQWAYNTDLNRINVSVVVKSNSEVNMPGKKIQFRYVVIPGEVLHQKNQTAQEVRRLSYDQLIKAFSLSS